MNIDYILDANTPRILHGTMQWMINSEAKSSHLLESKQHSRKAEIYQMQIMIRLCAVLQRSNLCSTEPCFHRSCQLTGVYN